MPRAFERQLTGAGAPHARLHFIIHACLWSHESLETFTIT